MAIQTNKARFSIVGFAALSPSTALGYAVTSNELLTVALEDTTGVQSATFSLYDSTDLSSPLASVNAPVLTFPGAVKSITVNSGLFNTTIQMPSTEVDAHTWILRCAAVVPGRTDVFERSLDFINNKMRKLVPGETTQTSQRGFTDLFDTYLGNRPQEYFGTGVTPASVTNVKFGALVIPRSTSVWVKARILAQSLTTPANATYYELDGTYSMSSVGVLTQKNAPTITLTRDLSAGSLLATVPTITVDSNQLNNSVTGIVSQSIRWTARWELFVMPNV